MYDLLDNTNCDTSKWGFSTEPFSAGDTAFLWEELILT